jgi:hypothetical protein
VSGFCWLATYEVEEGVTKQRKSRRTAPVIRESLSFVISEEKLILEVFDLDSKPGDEDFHLNREA